MQPTDFQKFKQIMAGMGRVFGADTDGVILDAYWLALKGWKLSEFEQAAGHLLANSQFMPKPAEFTALRRAVEQTSGEAFALARTILRRLSPREFIGHQSGDAKLDAALRACGGFEALAQCTSENIGFFERRFAEHYESISDADYTRESVPMLTSWGEPKKKLSGPTRLSEIAGNL